MRKMKGLKILLCMAVLILSVFQIKAYAQEPSQITLQDDADLLTYDEEKKLREELEGLTPYCKAIFMTSDKVGFPTAQYAEQKYDEIYGDASGVMFLIDMTHREIYVYAKGAAYKTITKAYAYTITDNVYTYASKGDYYTCASVAFSQIKDTLEGEKINRPMKHVSNLLLAVIFSVLANYWIMRKTSRVKETEIEDILEGTTSSIHFSRTFYDFLRKEKVRVTSSTGGGGGRSGGGSFGGGSSGGGGGRSSGGGGGHSF